MAQHPGSSSETTVVLNVDERFAMPAAVTLASLAASAAPGERIRAVMLHDDIPPAVRERVTRPLRDSAVTVEWRDGNTVEVDGFRTTDRFSRATFFRLALPTTLPDFDGRVIYLDADLVVTRSLAPLTALELDGAPFAAVPDAIFPFTSCAPGVPNWRDLGHDPRTFYCNIGVLVVDMAAWKAADVTRRAIAAMEQHGHLMHYQDQDCLNVALQGEWKVLAPEWNQQPSHLKPYGPVHLAHTPEEMAAAVERPAVVHYATVDKPWLPGCRHPHRDLWERALAATEWAGERRARRDWVRTSRRRIRAAARTLVRG